MASGWERYLTEVDKQLLAKTSWAKRSDFGLGAAPALLIVDAYYGTLGVPRAPMLDIVEEWPAACGTRGWDAIDATVPLLEQARQGGIPVFYLTGLAANPNPWNRKRAGRPRPAPTIPPSHQIVDEVKPREGEIVLEKCSPSGFATTGLAALLRAQGCDTLIVCGEATSGCVRATVVDGCVAGFAVGIASDCCFDRVEASHWMNLFDMNQKYGDVIDSAAVLDCLASVSGTRAAGA
jgi:maleamate amidohydrolase